MNKVFSIKKEQTHRVINILGIKFKIRRKQSKNDEIITYKNLKLKTQRKSNTDKLNITFTNQSSQTTLNFVTDSILPKYLVGGVGTALILASQFCIKNNMRLRIITRNNEPSRQYYEDFMNLMHENCVQDVQYYTDCRRDYFGRIKDKLELSNNELFFATSWWSAQALKNSGVNKFYYIIQEVEPFFYNYCDRHLMCSQILSDENICFIVNHKNLWNYFQHNYPNITNHGIYFNPCFPKHLYGNSVDNISKEKDKYKLFFYAREANSRNLYYTGLEILNTAIEKQILDINKWEIYFAGAELKKLELAKGYRPKFLGQLSWGDYAKFLKEIDCSFSLMYTPHPSYPPLDVVASGAVAVTNSFDYKTDCEWSENMLFGDLITEKMLEKLNEGLKLSRNLEKRIENYQSQTIPSDWGKELSNVITFMEQQVPQFLVEKGLIL